jgi:hypothetical protein
MHATPVRLLGDGVLFCLIDDLDTHVECLKYCVYVYYHLVPFALLIRDVVLLYLFVLPP